MKNNFILFDSFHFAYCLYIYYVLFYFILLTYDTEFDEFWCIYFCRMQDHHCHLNVLGRLVIWSIDVGQAIQIKGHILLRLSQFWSALLNHLNLIQIFSQLTNQDLLIQFLDVYLNAKLAKNLILAKQSNRCYYSSYYLKNCVILNPMNEKFVQIINAILFLLTFYNLIKKNINMCAF